MKTKKIANTSLARSIGSTLRLIRTYKGESSDAVAIVLGYKYASSYCKVERGEVHELSIETLLNFCNHFNISLLMLLLLLEQIENIDMTHIIPNERQLGDFINSTEKLLIEELIQFKTFIKH